MTVSNVRAVSYGVDAHSPMHNHHNTLRKGLLS